MFAIIRLGNQQFKVQAGNFIRVPFQNHSVNDQINIPVVAFGSSKNLVFDSSQLKKSKVKAQVIRQSLGRKVLVFKKKRRKGYRRTKGHRQKMTELKILELCSPSGEISKVKADSSKKVSDKKSISSEKKKTLADPAVKAPRAKSPAKKSSHKKVKKQALRAGKTRSSSVKKTAVKKKVEKAKK